MTLTFNPDVTNNINPDVTTNINPAALLEAHCDLNFVVCTHYPLAFWVVLHLALLSVFATPTL